MYRLSKEDMCRIAPLFDGWNETMVWSCLQGYMGDAWADDVENPKSVRILVGDFSFFAGASNSELVKNIPDNFSAPCILMVPGSDQWGVLIERVYQENCRKFTRYAFKKEPEIFDTDKLKSFVEKLPGEYAVRKIDKEVFHRVKKEQWSRDLCSQFSSDDEYEKSGLGFVITHHGEIVCGASSYTVYDRGIEIEIDTHKEYRRKGLALACASQLILECLKRGLYPSWDAANRESADLAGKLGYRLEKEYVTYAVTNFR